MIEVTNVIFIIKYNPKNVLKIIYLLIIIIKLKVL